MSQSGSLKASGGGGGGIINTINGDTGSITGANVTIFANNATNNSGASVAFINSGTISTLNLTDVNNNTFLGKGAGNITLTGTGNLGIGNGALADITTASNNICLGLNAGANIQPGDRNIAIGDSALTSAVGAEQCIAIGSEALMLCTSSGSIAIGAGAFKSLIGGTQNIAIGINSSELNVTGSGNVTIGEQSFGTTAANDFNIGIGLHTGINNAGNNNTIIGALAFAGTGTATQCAMFGFQAGNAITNGNNNTGLGYAAINQLLSGTDNIAVGHFAGVNLTTTESNNILIGSQGSAGESSTIRIGDIGNQTACYIQGITNVTVANSQFVTVDVNGQLGSTPNPVATFTSPLIDFTVATNTPIFTNSSGQRFLPTNIIFLADFIAGGIPSGCQCDFGWTGPTYNDFLQGKGYTVQATHQYQEGIITGGDTPLTIPVGQTLNINVVVPEISAPFNNGYVIVQGFYV